MRARQSAYSFVASLFAVILWTGVLLPLLSKGGEPSGPTPELAKKVLSKAYPLAFEGCETKNSLLVFKFLGRSFSYDDHTPKGPDEVMENPDLQDTLAQPYPLGAVSGPIPANSDPGRCRLQPLLEALYGSTDEEVRSYLVSIDFCGHKVPFNSRQGAAAALKEAGKDLDIIVRTNPSLRLYLEKLGGSFNRRNIAGTDRLSAHGFGIAIDLNPALAHYWRWDSSSGDYRPERFPLEIVKALEKHGFIWGGKWSHYDSMHFEFRPELIILAKEISLQP